MQLIRIECSSNIAAIGYDPDMQFLRVKFNDGRMYDWPATSAEKYARLMAAPSKGAYLRANFPAGVPCLPDGTSMEDGGEIRLKEHCVVEERAQSSHVQPLETFGEDECCSPILMKSQRTGNAWTCPQCGTEWRPQLIAGIKAWQPHETVMLW